MAKKKPNPRKIPATKADIEKAKKQGTDKAATFAIAIIFSALTDKMGWTTGWTKEQLLELWGHVDYIFDSVTKGYVTIPQLLHTLKEEYGVRIDT